jgi:hypothetical protein
LDSWPANTAALPTLVVLLLILFVASSMRNCPYGGRATL